MMPLTICIEQHAAVDTGYIWIDISSGRIGIGTDLPIQVFHRVHGDRT